MNAPARTPPTRFGPAILIGLTSIINIVAGVILKEAGTADTIALQLSGLAAAGLLGVGQFLIWRKAHQRYPLSLTYPFTALTFPMALGVAVVYRESIGPWHVLATILVATGVIVVHRSDTEEAI